ncbi:MAG TPA: RNA-binding protein [Candidatus Limnocylindrales bacterium]|nr:RNA-binding protein [Candidatus Limnocylindrales bacterium]
MKNVFVGNLDLGTTPDVIRALFDAHGAIRNLNLMVDRHTGLSRGFAFIEMADSEADSAIAALNDRIVEGQTISVCEGWPKLHRASREAPKPEA